MTSVLKWTFAGILGIVMILGGFLAVETIRDYKPPAIIELKKEGKAKKFSPDRLTIFTWNIGYAGLGKDMDFFADGGTTSIPPKDKFNEYLEGILKVVSKYSSVSDVMYFQEVDRDSDRSYHVDEYEKLKKVLKDFASVFAYNYVVDFVPVPLTHPMGKVSGGMATFSKYDFYDPVRIALPGQYSWPKNLFYLDRCMIVIRIPAPDGKEWVLINTHNSAFDNGDQREKQLSFIKKFITDEYEKGNYVIIGGDWNLMLGGNFKYTESPEEFYKPIPKDWAPKGWKWVIDKKIPTNRSVRAPYKKGKTFVTIIDGFLVSPNVKVLSVRGINLEFKYSDHNPVIAVFEMKK